MRAVSWRFAIVAVFALIIGAVSVSTAVPAGATAGVDVRVTFAAPRFGAQRVGTFGAFHTVTLTNNGVTTAQISLLELRGTDGLDWFGSTNCGTTLTSGASCLVHLYFWPRARGGRVAQLAINTDTPNRDKVRVNISGTGTLGYYLVRSSGATSSFGDGRILASPGLSGSIRAISPSPNGDGLVYATAAGAVGHSGNATTHGDLTAVNLTKPIVGIATTRTGSGYWMAGTDGGIFSFGDAHFYGSTGAIHLTKPIVAMARTGSGKGYWFVASDGGVFNYGDAHFYGSTGAIHLTKPIVGMAPTPSGRGYWLVASDGGIFAFGDAHFYGSTGAMSLVSSIIGMAASPDGRGYWLAAADGGLFTFGPGPQYLGSLGGHGLTDIVGFASSNPRVLPSPVGAATAARFARNSNERIIPVRR